MQHNNHPYLYLISFTILHEINDYVWCLLVDLRTAFDTVIHFLLIEKLQKLNMHTVINWISHCLTDRTQRVVINGGRSSRLFVSRCIVQGSGLGPLPFLIYILDLNLISNINVVVHTLMILISFALNTPSDFAEEFSHIVRLTDGI